MAGNSVSTPRASICAQRTSCRICGNEQLVLVTDLGEQYLAGLLIDQEQVPDLGYRYPLQLVRCDSSINEEACGLVQLRHTVSSDALYREYYYQSGINHSMRDNLRGIVHWVEQYAELNAGDIVLDIGCNDGSLLRFYSSTGLWRLGIDPSDVAATNGDDIEVVNEFFSVGVFHSASPDRKARVITSIAMFYDLEDPNAFVADIAACLDPLGIWVLEQSYLPTMLSRNAFDTICHEHLEYYSLSVLKKLMAGHGLRIVDAELNAVNGGSIRLMVVHAEGTAAVSDQGLARVHSIEQDESSLGLGSDAVFSRFRANTEAIHRDLLDLLQRARDEGKCVHAYGASTKGNTLLQYCGIHRELVSAVADRNPRKWGRYTIGSGIPIISEKESRAMNPDYYLVLPWHFLDEFIQREKEFLDRGGRFIISMPEVHLVGS